MTRVFVIAEVGINHNGDLETAKKMILAAKKCGADCVKFQTFKASEFVSDASQTYTYKSQGKEVTESMLEMFERYEFSAASWKEIVSFCKEQKIEFCSTAQNLSDLAFLFSITDLPFIKVGSDDLTNIPMLKEYAKHHKPMIISAGMAYASEIEDAVSAIRSVGNDDITVLHCVSSYPTPADAVNLRKIPVIRDAFGVQVGYSDHTVGHTAAVGAVCLGATVIEKHFTLDKNLPGPDHWFSSDVEEFQSYVLAIREIEKSLGSSILQPTTAELDMRNIARRKIVLSCDMKKGSAITKEHIIFKRSETEGIPPKFIDFVLGRVLLCDKSKNTALQLEDFA